MATGRERQDSVMMVSECVRQDIEEKLESCLIEQVRAKGRRGAVTKELHPPPAKTINKRNRSESASLDDALLVDAWKLLQVTNRGRRNAIANFLF